MDVTVRLAQVADIPQIIAVERSAAQIFRQIPALSFIADSDVMGERQHQAFIAEQAEWVAENAIGEVVGFIAIRSYEIDWNIAEISVREHWQRRGIGKRLMSFVIAQAADHGVHRLTLTTFIDVPWNAPYYQRHGFSLIPSHRLTPVLQHILAQEVAAGLPAESRCAMEFILS